VAQTSPALAVGSVDTGPVQEVVVTARKKAENLQDVPLSITAVTSQQLIATGATSLESITELSPGVTYTSFGAEANAQIIIRGISDNSGGYSTSQNVSVFLDGIYIKNPSAIDLAIGGVDRVEIVKGPVNTIYGRNAFMGAVNYVTKTPGDTIHIDAAYTAGTEGREVGEASISGPIIDGLLKGSIAGTYDTFDGLRDGVTHDYTNGHEKKDLLATLVLTPNSHITITPVFYHGDDFFTQPTTVSYASNCGVPGQTFLAGGDPYCGSLNKNQIGPYAAAYNPGAGAEGLDRRVNHLHVDAKFAYDFGTVDVLAGGNSIQTKNANEFDGSRYGTPFPTDTAAYAAANPSAFGPPGDGNGPTTLAESIFGAQTTEKDASIEGRYDSPQQYRVRVSFGGFYFYDVSSVFNTFGIYAPNVPPGYVLSTYFGPGTAAFYQTTNGQPNGSLLNYAKTGVEDKSGFVSGEVDLLKGPSYGVVTLGEELRYTNEDQKSSSTVGGGNYATASFGFTTSRTTLAWKPTPNYNVYFSAANGEKSGGFNSTAYSPLDATFAPETDWSYELGIKGNLFEHRLAYDVDVFHTDIDGLQQLSAPSAVKPNNPPVLVVKNFGTNTEDGIEAELKYDTGFGLVVGGGVALQDPRFGGQSYDSSDVGSCALIASCAPHLTYIKNVNGKPVVTTAADPIGVHVINLKGFRLPFASDETLNLNAEYRHPFEMYKFPDGHWFARIDYRYESKQYADLPNFSYYDARNVINLHLGIENRSWSVVGEILNATNDKTPIGGGYDSASNGILNATAEALATSVLPDSRTFSMRFAYHY
jgi:outer membrane receptor protein involved in Fe transport